MFYDNLTFNYGNVTVCLSCRYGTSYDVFVNLLYPFFYDLCEKYMTFMFNDNLTLNYGNVTVCLSCRYRTSYDVFVNLLYFFFFTTYVISI